MFLKKMKKTTNKLKDEKKTFSMQLMRKQKFMILYHNKNKVHLSYINIKPSVYILFSLNEYHVHSISHA